MRPIRESKIVPVPRVLHDVHELAALGVERDAVRSAGEDQHSAAPAGIRGAGGAAGGPRRRGAVPTPRWSAPPPATARRCSWRIGHAPAPAPTRRGWAWTATTTTRSGCGRRWWPRSRPARPCRRPAACTPRWVWRPGAQPEFLAELADALQALPRPIRLILDDVHELVDPVALHGLQTLMRNRPAGFQLVLSTRLDPPMSLPRLRLAGRLWELRAERLRFSPAEAATLLEGSGLRLTPGQVDTLHQRTGGWAAGLRLAALAVTRTADRDAFLDQFSGNEQLGRRLPGRGDPLEAAGGPPGVPARDQHQRPRPVRPGRGAVRPGGRREPARRARAPDLAAVRDRTAARCLPHPGAPAHLSDRRPAPPGTDSGPPSCTPRPPAGGQTRIGRSAPSTTPPASGNPALLSDLLRRFAVALILTGDHAAAAPRALQPGRPGHRVRPVAGPDLGTHPARGRRPVDRAG